MHPGEERGLRQQLRQMEARRANVERCGLVRTTMVGDGASGGVDDMMRAIESHLRAVVDQEQAHSEFTSHLSCEHICPGGDMRTAHFRQLEGPKLHLRICTASCAVPVGGSHG